MRVDALGACIELTSDRADLRSTAARLWRDCPADTGAAVAGRLHAAETGTGISLVREDGTTHSGLTESEAVSCLVTAVNLLGVQSSPDFCAHAAVVARDGAALVLPGASGAGKSTLTAALVRTGWAYVSDEALRLDWATGEMGRYARPLALTPWSASTVGVEGRGVAGVGESYLTADDLGGKVADGGLRPAYLVLPQRHGAITSLTPIPSTEALVELVRRSFTHYRHPDLVLPLVADVLRGSETCRLTYSDPVEAAEVLTRKLD